MKDPLNLTLQQRMILIECPCLKPKVVEKLKEAATGTQLVSFTSNEFDHLVGDLGAAVRFVKWRSCPDPIESRIQFRLESA